MAVRADCIEFAREREVESLNFVLRLSTNVLEPSGICKVTPCRINRVELHSYHLIHSPPLYDSLLLLPGSSVPIL